MSERPGSNGQQPAAAPQRPPPRGGFGGGWWMGGGMPAEKATRFGPSVRRLLGRLSPYRLRLLGVVALGVTSVVLQVIAPKVLGRATDLIFAGYIGKRLPAGLTNAQVVAAARHAGHGHLAHMLAR